MAVEYGSADQSGRATPQARALKKPKQSERQGGVADQWPTAAKNGLD